jgi:hypothetical protein
MKVSDQTHPPATWHSRRDFLKDKFRPRTGYEALELEQRYNFTLSLTSAFDGGFTAEKRDLLRTVQEAGCAPGPISKSTKNGKSSYFR